MKITKYVKQFISAFLIAMLVLGYLPEISVKASNNVIMPHDMENSQELKLNKTYSGTSLINQNNSWCYWFELPRTMKLTFTSSVTGNVPFYCVFICDQDGNTFDDFSIFCIDDVWNYKKLANTYSAKRSITLKPGTYYIYLAGYGGADSHEKNYSFKLNAVIPATPKIKSVTVTANDAAKISYPGIGSVDGYQIYRSTSKNGKYKLIKTTSKKSYTDTSVSHKTYYYKIRAYKKVGGVKCYSYTSSAKKVTIK